MAKFSKQDYIGVAQVIDTTWRKLLAESPDSSVTWQIRYDMLAVIDGFADMFGQDNDRFDRARFVTAAMGGAQ